MSEAPGRSGSEAPGLTARLARPDEVAAVGDLTVRAYLVGEALGPSDGYVAVLRDAATRLARAELWVGESDDRLVATMTLAAAGQDYAEVAGPGELEMRMLAVDPAARGQGIGAAMVATAERRAAELGCQQLVISVIDRNADAHRLYARLGFTRDPDRDWEPSPGTALQVSVKPVGRGTAPGPPEPG